MKATNHSTIDTIIKKATHLLDQEVHRRKQAATKQSISKGLPKYHFPKSTLEKIDAVVKMANDIKNKK